MSVDGHLGDAVAVAGRGLRGLWPPPAIDCANAGTLMRLLPGLLVGQGAEHVVLDGDDLVAGAPDDADRAAAAGDGRGRVHGARRDAAGGGGAEAPLHAAEHRLEIASAQVKSPCCSRGLFADGETWVHEPAPSRDHTERMLEAAGVPLLREGGAVGVRGPVERLSLPDLEVPGDFSSAAPHFVAGALLGDPEVRLEGVNLNPRRTGLLAVMRRMGADVREERAPTSQASRAAPLPSAAPARSTRPRSRPRRCRR